MDIGCIVAQITCTVSQTHTRDKNDQCNNSYFAHCAILQLHRYCYHWYLYLFEIVQCLNSSSLWATESKELFVLSIGIVLLFIS
jgi:hypothetical protein